MLGIFHQNASTRKVVTRRDSRLARESSRGKGVVSAVLLLLVLAALVRPTPQLVASPAAVLDDVSETTEQLRGERPPNTGKRQETKAYPEEMDQNMHLQEEVDEPDKDAKEPGEYGSEHQVEEGSADGATSPEHVEEEEVTLNTQGTDATIGDTWEGSDVLKEPVDDPDKVASDRSGSLMTTTTTTEPAKNNEEVTIGNTQEGAENEQDNGDRDSDRQETDGSEGTDEKDTDEEQDDKDIDDDEEEEDKDTGDANEEAEAEGDTEQEPANDEAVSA